MRARRSRLSRCEGCRQASVLTSYTQVDPTQVYGVNWKPRGTRPQRLAPLMTDIWIDDLYFAK